jgi:hypothetical protein
MKLLVALLGISLLLGGVASAQLCNGMGNAAVTDYATETLSITSGAALPFTAAVYAPSGKAPKMAQVNLATQSINYTLVAGQLPTTTTGSAVTIPSGATSTPFIVCGESNIRNFQGIATTGTAVLTINYFQ